MKPRRAPVADGELKPADAVAQPWLERLLPAPVLPYARLARLDRPIGWWLLLLPCWWSAALAAVAAGRAYPDPLHMGLFLVGAIAMRGSGSAWNDIVDRKIDAAVERTRGRPLPAGQIGVAGAIVFAVLLALVGLAVLLQFNAVAIVVGLCSLVPVAIYPFMKRVMSHPQLVLGLAFGWGALMGWVAVFGALGLAPLLLYAGTVLWIVGYDTIYALQDREDDAIVGVGSTARHYGASAPRFVLWCYAGALVFIGWSYAVVGVGWPAYLGLASFALHLVAQALWLRIDQPARALALFRSNRSAGLLLLAGLLAEPLPALIGPPLAALLT